MPGVTLADLKASGLPDSDATALLAAVGPVLDEPDCTLAWQGISALLQPEHPFAVHQLLFDAAYSNWSAVQGPRVAWMPGAEHIASSNLATLLAEGTYDQLQHLSVRSPGEYWSHVLKKLRVAFRIQPDHIVDRSEGMEQAVWLPGAHLNIVESCFEERDLQGLGLIWQSEGGELETMSLGDLMRQVHTVAWALQANGFLPGDAIGACMPMTPNSVVLYLGTILAGCVVVSIADSFAPQEIATRLRLANARGIFTQDVIHRGGKTWPLYERVVQAEAPRAIVLPAGENLSVELRDGDLAWEHFVSEGGTPDHFDACVVGADTATNILFSSGTTGEPKAIPWTHITPIKAAADGWAHHDIHQGDVVAWPTNLGWMMGPWLIYASLLNGASIALYDGVPSGAGFCRFVQDAGVTMLGVVPSLVRAWRAADATAGLDWSRIRCFSSTGEASNPEDMLWLMSRAGYRPVVEYCGGTEIGGGYICGSLLQPQAPSMFSSPAMGTSFLLLDEEGQPADEGELALLPPLLGSSTRLLNSDHHSVYFEGMPAGPDGQVLRRHGDQMRRLPGGFYRAQGRVDDTMNLGGIKISSAELERACNRASGVVETAAVARSPQGGGPDQLVVFAVLEAPLEHSDLEDLRAELQKLVRSSLNPLFKVHQLRQIDALPRTVSGKVMRRVLRKSAHSSTND